MPCVYIITSPSGKQYIGMSVYEADVRFNQHANAAGPKKGRMPVFHRAIKKYGREAFVVKTLAIGSRSYCAALEERAIKAFGTLYPKGYNLVKGGEGSGTMTTASKRRQSASLVAALASPEAKQRMSEAQKRIWSDPVRRKKHSDSVRAAFASPESRERLVAAQKAGNADPAVKARKSEIMRQRMADPEVKRATVTRMLAARGIEYQEKT